MHVHDSVFARLEQVCDGPLAVVPRSVSPSRPSVSRSRVVCASGFRVGVVRLCVRITYSKSYVRSPSRTVDAELRAGGFLLQMRTAHALRAVFYESHHRCVAVDAAATTALPAATTATTSSSAATLATTSATLAS